MAGYTGARALVLGASGFIGRWVAHALERQGAEVYPVVRSRSNAVALFAEYGISGEPVEADLTDDDSVRLVFEKVKPSVVFNLAGYGVDRSERDEALSSRINTRLVGVICESMQAQGIAWPGQQMIHTGSALEYGVASGNLAEDSEPLPTTVYGESKLAGTVLLQEFSRRNGFRAVTARLFTVYGLGEHDGRLVPTLLAAARTGKPIELTAGTQKRDFTYVEDVVEGLLRLGLSNAAPGEIVNLATGHLESVRTFSDTAAQILGIPADLLQWGKLPSRGDDMAHLPVTIEKLRKVTGWVPQMGIEAGIQAMQLIQTTKSTSTRFPLAL